MSHAEDSKLEPTPQGDMTFELDATEEELLDEFGLLMAAEYNYMTTQPAMLKGPGRPAGRAELKTDADQLKRVRPDIAELYQRFRGEGDAPRPG